MLLLDTLHHGSYVSSSRPVPCPPLLRRLQTSSLASAGLSSVAELEAPNLVFSYAAVSRIELSWPAEYPYTDAKRALAAR